MRNITYTVYKYDELPTESAKAKARDWWIDLELQDPAFAHELWNSLNVARRAMANHLCYSDIISSLRDEYPWSGTCYDAEIIDWMRVKIANLEDNIDHHDYSMLSDHMSRYFQTELEDRCSDVDAIAETLITNEYEFTEQGEFA